MSQPKWKLVANLGDVNWFDHGGIFVYQDETNVYDPEIEILHEKDQPGNRFVDRFVAEKCYFENNILSDNKDCSVWFADDLASISSFSGQTEEELINLLCSDDPIERALGYLPIYHYWGIDNLGGDTEEYTPLETSNRYRHAISRI